MTKTQQKIAALTAALIKAKETALLFADTYDGGTCNMDSPMLYLPGWRKADVEAAFAAADLRCFEYKGYGPKAWVICGGTYGQGDCRTTMAEAMYKSLKRDGYDASMYYQMD